MKLFRNLLKVVLRIIAGFGVFVLLYLWVAEQLADVRWNSPCMINADEGIVIYVKSNGVHTDLVLPVKNEEKDWRSVFPPGTFEQVDSTFEYITFGWGDKGFYLDTPTWADLKASTAFKAAFFMSSTAMHVSYRHRAPQENMECIRLVVSQEQYSFLCADILRSFSTAQGKVQRIAHPGYGNNDNFYEAFGTYSLFNTCNVWTGRKLNACGVRVGCWTPLERHVMRSLRN